MYFSDHHNSYYSAYNCVTNDDSKVLHSSGHPDLTTAPKPEAGIAYKKRKGKDDCRVKTRKQRGERLTVYDVCKIYPGESDYYQATVGWPSNGSRTRREYLVFGAVHC